MDSTVNLDSSHHQPARGNENKHPQIDELPLPLTGKGASSTIQVGQRHSVWASQLIPKWFEGVFILENTKDYFLKGTFDFFDVLASSVGAAAALWVMARTIEERRD